MHGRGAGFGAVASCQKKGRIPFPRARSGGGQCEVSEPPHSLDGSQGLALREASQVTPGPTIEP